MPQVRGTHLPQSLRRSHPAASIVLGDVYLTATTRPGKRPAARPSGRRGSSRPPALTHKLLSICHKYRGSGGLRSNDSALRILYENRRTLHRVVAEAPRCKSLSAPKTSMRKRLDLWQMEELERALSLPPHSFLAVQGPPGTGKTSVIAATACELATAGGRCSSRRLQTWPLITP